MAKKLNTATAQNSNTETVSAVETKSPTPAGVDLRAVQRMGALAYLPVLLAAILQVASLGLVVALGFLVVAQGNALRRMSDENQSARVEAATKELDAALAKLDEATKRAEQSVKAAEDARQTIADLAKIAGASAENANTTAANARMSTEKLTAKSSGNIYRIYNFEPIPEIPKLVPTPLPGPAENTNRNPPVTPNSTSPGDQPPKTENPK